MAVWVGTKDEKVCLEQREEDGVREGGWSLHGTGSQFLFLLLLPQSWLLTAAVAQPALSFSSQSSQSSIQNITFQQPKYSDSFFFVRYVPTALYLKHTLRRIMLIITSYGPLYITIIWLFHLQIYCLKLIFLIINNLHWHFNCVISFDFCVLQHTYPIWNLHKTSAPFTWSRWNVVKVYLKCVLCIPVFITCTLLCWNLVRACFLVNRQCHCTFCFL